MGTSTSPVGFWVRAFWGAALRVKGFRGLGV